MECGGRGKGGGLSKWPGSLWGGGQEKKGQKDQGGKKQEEIHTGDQRRDRNVTARYGEQEIQTLVSLPQVPGLPPAHWNEPFQLESFQMRGPDYF